jgi:hypothetical protein
VHDQGHLARLVPSGFPEGAGSGQRTGTASVNGGCGLAAGGYESVPVPSGPATAPPSTAMFRRRSCQPSRRAVLHIQATGDPAVPAGLAAWYTERAFHFYLVGLRLPGQAPVGARPAARYLKTAFADLDAACAHLREGEGMASVIVSAQGRGAIAAALWSDARGRDARESAADAMILLAPQLPAGAALTLDVDCPVLVLSDPADEGPAAAGAAAPRGVRVRAAWRQHRTGAADRSALNLGGHVTWLRLPATTGDAAGDASGADSRQLFSELGRWLGAYMYGGVRDQLL